MAQPRPVNENAAVIKRCLTHTDLQSVSALHALVFGPGRFARTAYRVREGTPAISRFCYGAFLGDRLIASLRMTPISIGASGPHVLLGPLAVHPEFAGQGHGKALVALSLSHAKACGIGIVALIGDLPYYARFGFAPVKPGQIVFPGPVNPARILACELTPSTLNAATGLVTAIDA